MIISYASRASVIYNLDLSYVLQPRGKYVFTFYKLRKSWKFGKALSSLEFCEYTEDRDLCAVITLNEYIKRTNQQQA